MVMPTRTSRLIEAGDLVRLTDDALRLHYEVWATRCCTEDDFRPYVRPPTEGVARSVTATTPIRLLEVRWSDGSESVWQDDMMDPVGGR